MRKLFKLFSNFHYSDPLNKKEKLNDESIINKQFTIFLTTSFNICQKYKLFQIFSAKHTRQSGAQQVRQPGQVCGRLSRDSAGRCRADQKQLLLKPGQDQSGQPPGRHRRSGQHAEQLDQPFELQRQKLGRGPQGQQDVPGRLAPGPGRVGPSY